MNLRLILAAAAFALPASAVAQDSPPGVTWHDGPPPAAEHGEPPVGWQASIDEYLQKSLKDPYSAVKRQASPVWWGKFRTAGLWSKPAGSWAVCYAVNAKNSYSGYTGEQLYLFLLRDDGRVAEVASTDSRDGGAAFSAADARRECSYRVPPA